MTLPLHHISEIPNVNPKMTEFSGFDIIQLIRRNAALILFVTLSGSLPTALWINRQPQTYVSSAAVVLRGSDALSDMDSNPQGQNSISPTQVFTEAEVMSSRNFVRSLAERLDLYSDPRYNPALAEPAAESVFTRFLTYFGNQFDLSDQIFRVETRVATLMKRVRTFLALAEADDPRDLSPEEQRDAVVENLLAQYSVSASDRHNVIRIQVRNTDPALASFIANEATALYIESRSSDQLRDLDRLINFLTRRSQEIESGLASTQAEVAALIRDFGLQDTLKNEMLIAENMRLKNRLALADLDTASAAATSARIAEIEQALDDHVRAELKLAERELALKTETNRFDTVQQRLDELEAQRETPNHDVAQIARAEVPVKPVGPVFGATMAVAFMAFMLIGIIIAILRENIDRRVTSQADAENASGLPVVTSLPKLPRRLLRRNGGAPGVVHNGADNSYTNGISALVTLVMQDMPADRAPVVLIGSALSDEGKSSVSASIAVSAASDDLKVLIIDFDVHRSGASKYLDVPMGRKSMTALLQQERPISQFITETKFPGVDLMNFKPRSRVSRRVLRTESAQNVFNVLRQRYHLIIIDTPPFLSSEEAGRLSGIVDRAILVGGWRMCSRDALTATVHRMKKNRLNVVGMVINGIDPSSALAYGYYSYSAEYYGKSHA